MYLYLLSAALLVAIIGWFIHRAFNNVVEKNNQPVPEEYADIKPISNGYTNNIFTVKLLCTSEVSSAASPNPIRAFTSINGQLIVACYAEKDDSSKGDYRYYKLDSIGKTIDSLYLKYDGHWAQFIDGYIVFTSDEGAFYNTWPFDGDTTPKPVQAHKTALDQPANIIANEVQEVKKSHYYFANNYVLGDNVFALAHYYYDGRTWQVLWQQTATYNDISDSASSTRYRTDVYRSGEEDPYLHPGTNLQYFHHTDKIRYMHPGSGGSQGFGATNWRGTGFLQVVIGNKSFHFSIPDLVMEKERFDNYEPRLYLVREPGDGVLHVNTAFYISPKGFALYAPNTSELYIISSNTVLTEQRK